MDVNTVKLNEYIGIPRVVIHYVATYRGLIVGCK